MPIEIMPRNFNFSSIKRSSEVCPRSKYEFDKFKVGEIRKYTVDGDFIISLSNVKASVKEFEKRSKREYIAEFSGDYEALYVKRLK